MLLNIRKKIKTLRKSTPENGYRKEKKDFWSLKKDRKNREMVKCARHMKIFSVYKSK